MKLPKQPLTIPAPVIELVVTLLILVIKRK
ncbi:Uncharacterised protein [Lysinibacillus sphaericus]|nr:Uncharacterised protein [Lysinibacillus sphaericus]